MKVSNHTHRAFEEAGFEYIGFEKDLEIYDLAKERLETFKSQIRLF